MADHNKFTDQELLLLLKEGNQRAMTEIFERYWQRLLAVALNRLDNLEEAEECVQDVFIKLWKLRQNLELKYNLNTYLSAAVRYRVFDLLDKQHRKVQYTAELLSNAAADLNESADANLLEKELMEQLEASVKQLPQKCQMIYRMSREQGKNNKQIAREMEISEKTVEAHLTKAIKDIRNNLSTASPVIVLLCFNELYNKL